MPERRKTLKQPHHKRGTPPKKIVRREKKNVARPYIEDHPNVRKLEAQARSRYASPTARSDAAGALLLQKTLLRTLGHEPKPPPPKLTLHIGDAEDRERYRRMIASATDTPRSSVPMGGKCCGSRHKKGRAHK